MYEVLSGPAGQTRDWDRFRSLFAEGARLMPLISLPDQPVRVRLLSPDDYIRRVEPILKKEDFWEKESGRQTETFGQAAHVLSSYESLRAADGTPFERGKNSIQLFHDGSRWWIVSVMWNTSRAE
jgi:hypothetical protein